MDAVDAVEVAFGLSDEDAAEDGAGFGDQVGGEDGIGFAGEAGSEVVEVGVDQLGVVDQADRPVGAVGVFEFDEGAEAVVVRSGRIEKFGLFIDLDEVVAVGTGFDDFADTHGRGRGFVVLLF